ncbi:hypothetical protein [Chitinophaga sp. CF418]|uniref:hypothetical protein n=1 Tax=Chitinophaga sp. CF418 TaxID=1855287 RepID=UPI000919E9C7|nr:hypothetical protein [Chitinophaga sp. CF418]SHN16249.1 hypothetical protein SAMN05216311_10654 [Chitinophaga sp. CF418]
MFIKRILALLIVLVAGYGIANAQGGRPPVAGTWEVVKIETRLFSQEDNQLLEKKTLTKAEEFKNLTGFVPMKISVEGENCMITNASGFTETGKYKIEEKGVLLYQKALPPMPQNVMPGIPSPEAPYLPYRYKVQSGGTLLLELPGASFMDTARSVPVVLECTCYYKKKQ